MAGKLDRRKLLKWSTLMTASIFLGDLSPAWFLMRGLMEGLFTPSPIPFSVSWHNVGTPLYVAHRGSKMTAPENTMPAFRSAFEWGIPIETDVQRTKDGTLVLSHDPTVDRQTNGSGYISEKSIAEIKALDAGSKFSSSFAGELIPTLDELLVHAGPNLMILELKSETFAEATALKLREHKVQPYVMVAQQSGVGGLNIVHTIDPSIPLLRYYMINDPLHSLVAECRNNHISWVGVDSRNMSLTQSLVAQAHEVGIRVLVTGIATRFQRALVERYGVDGYLVSDYPHISGHLGNQEMGLPFTLPFVRDYFGSGWYVDTLGQTQPFQIGGGFLGRRTAGGPATTFAVFTQHSFPRSPVKLSVTITPRELAADATRWAAIQVLLSDEPVVAFRPVPDGLAGYSFVWRQNGALQIDKLTGGENAATLGVMTGAGMVRDKAVPFEIVLDAESVSFKRTDTGTTVSARDNTYRGGWVGFLNAGSATQFSNFSTSAV